METFIIIGVVLIALGVLGSILPAVPGPFFSFLGILMLYFSEKGEASLWEILAFGTAMAVLLILDYIAPIVGAKYSGAGKAGIWGSVFGAIIGLVFFPPLGIFIGALIGAIAGEIAGGKKFNEAIRAGIGVMLGTLSIMILQIIYSLAAAVYFLVKVI